MRLRIVLLCVVVCLLAATAAWGQDAAKGDPKHYKVESENAEMRILRVHYGPHEKSVMHSHPDGAVVYLSDGSITFHMPDGKTQNNSGKSGQALYTPAVVHDPENTGDKPFDAIVIELKSGGTASKSSKK
jgi:quercetin dioxygenase-like cupin family protein